MTYIFSVDLFPYTGHECLRYLSAQELCLKLVKSLEMRHSVGYIKWASSALHCSGNRVIKRLYYYARVITFTTLIIASLLKCHLIFRQAPKLASRGTIHMWPRFFVRFFVLYAFCAITYLRDPEIDTKCSKCVLSEESQQMYVECGVAFSWVQLPLLVTL